MAAIVIGMGGKTNVMWEDSQLKLSDLIKTGESEAIITIKLYKNENDDVYTFTRKFDLDNKSKYTIDGNEVRFDFNESFFQVVLIN